MEQQPKIHMPSKAFHQPYDVGIPYVMVVSNDQDFVSRTVKMLRFNGFVASGETNAAGALKKLNLCGASQPGVIVSDLEMEGLSGLHLARSLEVFPARIRPGILFLSDGTDFGSVLSALRLRAMDFLLKPPADDVLVSAVERALNAFMSREIGGDEEPIEFQPSRVPQSNEGPETSNFQSRQMLKQQTDAAEPSKLLADVLEAMNAKNSGLDHSEVRILTDVTWCDHIGKTTTVMGLAYGLSLPAATTHRKIKRLQENGYVKRWCDDEDRRVCYISITEEGRRIVEDIEAAIGRRLQVHVDDR